MQRFLAQTAVWSTLLALSLGDPGPVRADLLYGSNRAGAIFTVNTSTGVGTLVGMMPFAATEIAYDNATGRAWAQQPDGAFTIHEFDINTAAGIGPFVGTAASFTGLEFVGPTLYGTAITGPGSPSTLRTLNPMTGMSTVIGPTGRGPIAGLAFNPATGIMYGIDGNFGIASLSTINLSTGAATVIGSTGILNAGSLSFGPDGNLYAGSTGTTGDLYRLNLATGAGTLVGRTGFGTVTGLTLVQTAGPIVVPEPASLTLLGIGALGLFGYGWRRWRHST